MKNKIVAHNDLKIRIEDNFFNSIESKLQKLATLYKKKTKKRLAHELI